jgi:hypothetical protein
MLPFWPGTPGRNGPRVHSGLDVYSSTQVLSPRANKTAYVIRLSRTAHTSSYGKTTHILRVFKFRQNIWVKMLNPVIQMSVGKGTG